MVVASLLKTEKIPEIIFQEFLSRQIFYSYFLADDNFYLFLYAKNILFLDFLYQNNEVKILEELDSRTRQIRSVRGFIIYCLDIMRHSKKLKILSTNLKPFFWKKVERILNQNKKQALEEFLIPKQNSKNSEKNIEIKLQTLEEKIEFLEKRIFTLEDTKKDITSSALNDREGSKITDLEYSTLKTKGEDLKPAFKSLKEISEKDKIEIIKRGFDLRREKNISLKDYYERGFLFEWKKYHLKYDSIRQTNLFKKLKNERLNYPEESLK